MKCEVCNQGPEQGVTLYRVNPTGETGRWRCPQHLDEGQRQSVDPEVRRIVEIVECRRDVHPQILPVDKNNGSQEITDRDES